MKKNNLNLNKKLFTESKKIYKQWQIDTENTLKSVKVIVKSLDPTTVFGKIIIKDQKISLVREPGGFANSILFATIHAKLPFQTKKFKGDISIYSSSGNLTLYTNPSVKGHYTTYCKNISALKKELKKKFL